MEPAPQDPHAKGQVPIVLPSSAAASSTADESGPLGPKLVESEFDDEIARRAKERPMTRARTLPLDARFKAICNTLQRSGLALTITVKINEEDAKLAMSQCFDLRFDDPIHLIMDLQDLELGDVVAIALVGDKIYYHPRAAPNIYHDPVKREAFAKVREEEEKAKLKFAEKHKKNMSLRLLEVEKQVQRLSGYEANLERAERAVRELMKLNKVESSLEDTVQALREQVADVRQYTVLVPSISDRLKTVEEKLRRYEEHDDQLAVDLQLEEAARARGG